MRAKLIVLVYLSIFAYVPASLAAVVTAPAQPESGPGGRSYEHKSVVGHSYGRGDTQYWLFEPADPKPESAPVVIFSHGWGAMMPAPYLVWIEHLVQRGNIVIYPRYQGSLTTKPAGYLANEIMAVKAALNLMQTEPGHVQPRLDEVAAVGHSAGGQISAGLASQGQSYGLPAIKAVMCVEPGKSWGPQQLRIPLADMRMMPPSTLLITVAGDRDVIVRDVDAKRIYTETTQVPGQNKSFVTLVSDEHGTPPLIADHFCPAGKLETQSQQTLTGLDPQRDDSGGPIRQFINAKIRSHVLAELQGPDGVRPDTVRQRMKQVDALDYFGLWKLFDALEDAAFYDKNREYALGNTPQQRYMGKWSDGVAVKEMIVNEAEPRKP